MPHCHLPFHEQLHKSVRVLGVIKGIKSIDCEVRGIILLCPTQLSFGEQAATEEYARVSGLTDILKQTTVYKPPGV